MKACAARAYDGEDYETHGPEKCQQRCLASIFWERTKVQSERAGSKWHIAQATHLRQQLRRIVWHPYRTFSRCRTSALLIHDRRRVQSGVVLECVVVAEQAHVQHCADGVRVARALFLISADTPG